jgi:hypothetical protein
MSSSRRAGNDQSILEMLERDTGRSSLRGGRSRLRWYGAGGALAVGLIGLLIWLTHDSAPPEETQPIVVAEAPAPAERAAKPDPAAELMGLNDLDDPPRPHHAAVIDGQSARQTKPITPVAMLTPSSRSPQAATGAGKGAVVQDDPAAPNTPAKAPAAVARHEATAKNVAARPVADPARARVPAKQPASSNDRSSQRKLALNAPRVRKAAPPAQPSRPAVDSDVALISAVIQHSSARISPECLDVTCAAKTTAQP